MDIRYPVPAIGDSMDYIEARGKRNNFSVNVKIKKAENGYIIDLNNYAFEKSLRKILNGDVIVGGTYPAPDGSLLKAWYALDEFFDRGWEGSMHGEVEPIPYAEGVIY